SSCHHVGRWAPCSPRLNPPDSLEPHVLESSESGAKSHLFRAVKSHLCRYKCTPCLRLRPQPLSSLPMSFLRPSNSRIPIFRPFTPPATPLVISKPLTPDSSPRSSQSEDDSSTDEERRAEAIRIRLTCSTPTFNQSTKFLHLVSTGGKDPLLPGIQRGQGIGGLKRYTDYKETLTDGVVPSPSSPTLTRKPSRLRMTLRRAKTMASLRTSDRRSDTDTSRCSSPGATVPFDKPPPLPSFFSPCTSPAKEYLPDYDYESEFVAPQIRSTRSLQSFKIRRKPVPTYYPSPPTSDSSSDDSSASEDNVELEQSGAIQNVGPDVFIAYNDDDSFALTTAFTHVIRLVHADAVGLCLPSSSTTFDHSTGVHPPAPHIPSPVAPVQDDISVAALRPIGEVPRPHRGRAPAPDCSLLFHPRQPPTIQWFQSRRAIRV
ncbi:hypothetical protein FB45DRAFT_32043, partial [Roridomyces roridus]